MEIEVDVDGTAVRVACEDSFTSAWVTRAILENRTYPALPFVPDVEVVLDVGANCGAAAVHFALHHPGARIHAFEPAAGPRAVADRNAAAHPTISVHPFGLSDHEAEVELFHASESVMSSVKPAFPVGTSEIVRLRRGDSWAREAGIERVDVLKVDVEGTELLVLQGLGPLVAGSRVVYVEYDSREDRRSIDAHLAPTHQLYFAAAQYLDQGEAVYLANDLCDLPGAADELITIGKRLWPSWTGDAG